MTPDCIRNCFLQVPIMPESHIEQLRSLGLESRSNYVERLQKELEREYAGHEDIITKHKDYSVLEYLSMNESDGPSEVILAIINKTRREDGYKDLFLPVNEADFIEEDAED